MRALVTGGAGFIGSHIADRLIEEGWQVRLLDSLQPRVHPNGPPPWLPPSAELVRGDVADAECLRACLEGVDAVFHQAAYQDYMTDYSHFFRTNVTPTALLYELIAAGRLPVRRVVVASSQAVYGEGEYLCAEHGMVQPGPRREEDLRAGCWSPSCPHCAGALQTLTLREDRVDPQNPYALSKYCEEIVALRLGRAQGVPTVALRYSITQGPRQSPFNAYSGVCRIFTQQLLRGEPPTVFEDGLQTRDFVHVADVVDANLIALRDERASYRAYNVGSGRATTVLEYACQLAEVLGSDVEPRLTGEYRVGDNRNSVSDIARLTALGFRPRRSLRDVFVDYSEWLREVDLSLAGIDEAQNDMRDSGVIRRLSPPTVRSPAAVEVGS